MATANTIPFQKLFHVPLRNGLTRPKAVRGAGVKMVNMGEVFAHDRIRNVPMDRVPLNSKERETSLLERGDLLFARQSLVLEGAGKCSVFLDDKEPVTFESHLIRARLDPTVADPLFFFYFFRSPAGRDAIRSIVEQVAAAGIRGRDLANLPVPQIPVRQQRTIAHILGTLDDKIELNRRMNETLEEMARALFKSWFVDFDPVRAKMEGRQPFSMDDETAALFPDSFEDSPLGEIPKGWNIASIGEVVKVMGGGTPSTKEPLFWDGGTHCWATPKDLSKLQSPVLLDTERKVTDAGLAKISSGLLPVGTVLLSSRAPIGYLAVAQVPVAVNQGFIAMLCDGPLTTHYVLHWARINVEQIKGRAGGTTFPEISKKNFRSISVLMPFDEVLSAFEKQVVPLYDKMSANLRQSATLAAVRDALLPKLLSGEVRVGEAEEIVEETA